MQIPVRAGDWGWEERCEAPELPLPNSQALGGGGEKHKVLGVRALGRLLLALGPRGVGQCDCGVMNLGNR